MTYTKKLLTILFTILISLTMVTSLFGGSSAPSDPEPEYLNYGLYFLGYDGAKEKFEPGEFNQFYDPSKPVIIFFHGWQNTSSEKGYAMVDLWWDKGGAWTHNNWIDKGYNVAIYHWAQWADEDDVQWAEAKIWTRNGPKGFRYRLKDGSFSTALNPGGNKAVGELAYDTIVAALSGNTSENIRFAGHSLGNQLATRVAEQIYNNIIAGNLSENTFRLKRLALLDPAFTKNGKSWLGDSNGDGKNDWVGERVRWAAFKMIDRWTNVNDFVVEVYNTTALDTQLGIAMDANLELRTRTVGTVSVRPWYFGATDIANKHNAAYYHYFWTGAFAAPVECTISWTTRYSTGQMGPSASTPNWRMKQMMGDTYKWDQVEGRYTPSPEDDWFERKNF